MVESQIYTLTAAPSFGHNLCCKYLNKSCKPILNTCVLKDFQWYKEVFNPMSFDYWNYYLKIPDSISIPIPKMGVHLGVCEFIPSHSHTLWECKCDSHVAFLTCTFSCPCFDQEPKARVVTFISSIVSTSLTTSLHSGFPIAPIKPQLSWDE